MTCLYLIEGPVGAGKSTFAQHLSREIAAPHLNLDAWMARLFRPDRPDTDVMTWYVARKARCIEQIWEVATAMLDTGHPVVLELGLIQRDSRYAFYERVARSGHALQVCLLDAPISVRHDRVRCRNLEQGSTYAMDVSDEVFELASALWEAPDAAERAAQKIVFVDAEHP